MINWWDDALANHSSLFAQQNPDTNVMLFDAHAVLSGILDEPAKYGFVNTTGYCAAYNQPDILTDPEKYRVVNQSTRLQY
jgi:phospholipase/lecithinase/hemolysin